MSQEDQCKHDVVDVEQFAKSGKKIPQADKYRIRIDKQHYVVTEPELTGAAILALAQQQPPERYSLYQKLKGGETKKVELDTVVDFREPGVERFMTLPLDQTEGADPAEVQNEPRRHFELLPEDQAFLERLDLAWEAVIDNNVKRVVIYGYPLPDGYRADCADLNVRIERSYPDTQIDMVYFYPALEKNEGRAIGAIANDNFDGKVWQRWSRHRTKQSPWRPGIDNLESHLMLVSEWLTREVQKG
jgi:hypothetical protein